MQGGGNGPGQELDDPSPTRTTEGHHLVRGSGSVAPSVQIIDQDKVVVMHSNDGKIAGAWL
jgi:hypothetical protein